MALAAKEILSPLTTLLERESTNPCGRNEQHVLGPKATVDRIVAAVAAAQQRRYQNNL